METPNDTRFHPGHEVPESGIYAQFDKDNQYVDVATCVKGEPFPPTQCAGGYWRVHVPTSDVEPSNEE